MATVRPPPRWLGQPNIDAEGRRERALQGWIAVGVLAVLFMPLAWIPCCMQDCALVRLA